jgi:hypothetical protein
MAAAVIVFGGFAPTYYLKAAYGTPALAPVLHLHGAVFSAWFILAVVQPALVAAHRTALHKQLGVAGAALALGMVVLGTIVAIATASRPAVPGLPDPLMFLVIPLGDIVAFAILVSVALYKRRQRDTHKRLMLLATIAILNAAFARWIVPGGVLAFLGIPFSPLILIALTATFIAPCLIYDRMTRGRIHPAFLWGGIVIIAADVLRLALGGTGAWLTFAGWLTS